MLGGASLPSQMRYEKGSREPDLEYLQKIGAAGADILYIITGVRSASAATLAPRDAALLDNFHALNEQDKRSVERIATLAAKCDCTQDMSNKKKAVR